jgi:thioredoxin reductase
MIASDHDRRFAVKRKSIIIIGAGLGGLSAGIYGQLNGYKTDILENFYFTGTWATAAGALFMNALSGKRVIQSLCREDRSPFLPRRD